MPAGSRRAGIRACGLTFPLRGKLTGKLLQGERLRAYRTVEVLELIGTPAARQVLQSLAEGAPGALVTTSAKAALKR